jgi:hypothetical protein
MSPLDQWDELLRRNVIGAGRDQQFTFLYVADVSLTVKNASFGFNPSLSNEQLMSFLEPKSREDSPSWLQADWPPPVVPSPSMAIATALWRIKAALALRTGTKGTSTEEIEAAPLLLLPSLKDQLNSGRIYRAFRASIGIDLRNAEAIAWGLGGIAQSGSVVQVQPQLTNGVPWEELLYQMLLRIDITRRLNKVLNSEDY